MICAACGLIRDPADLIAFWPVGQPDRVRYVCRPTRPSPIAEASCFRVAVSTADVHAIATTELVTRPRLQALPA